MDCESLNPIVNGFSSLMIVNIVKSQRNTMNLVEVYVTDDC